MECSAATLQGSFPAIVTPFTKDGEQVDEQSLRALINEMYKAGSRGIVACGSTGEAMTLSDDEYKAVVSIAKEESAKKGICIAGIGTNNTARAKEVAKTLESIGVDGILLVAPPYNKPPQDGIYAHFAEVKKTTRLPIIAYNIPGRSSVNILPKTIAKLAESRIIVGLKESSGSMDQVMDIVALVGESISILSGEDSLVHSIMASGGKGVISASANAIPELFSQMTEAALLGHFGDSLKLQLKALPIVRAMFTETNPIPVKAALALKGIIKYPSVRLPLLPASRATEDLLRSVLGL